MVNLLGGGRNGNWYVADIVIYFTEGMLSSREPRQYLHVILFEFLEFNRKKLTKAYQSNKFLVFSL